MTRVTRRQVLLATAVLAGPALAAPAMPERPLTRRTLAQVRAAHEGRPLIVHLWGMTCGPCLTELPRWGQFRRRHPEAALVLVQADQAPPRARQQTLAGAGLAQVESWYATAEPDEFLRASIDPAWQGEMPMTLLIAPGGRTKLIRGAADLALVERWLAAGGAGD